jgi:hypothetical protein
MTSTTCAAMENATAGHIRSLRESAVATGIRRI